MSLTLTRRHNVDRFGYLIPTRYGNLPMVGAVATYRPGEGRFGGAVAVEEATENHFRNPLFDDGVSGWVVSNSTPYASIEIRSGVGQYGNGNVLVLKTTQGGSGTLIGGFSQSGIPLAPGTEATVSIRVRRVKGSTNLVFRWGGGGSSGRFVFQVPKNNVWYTLWGATVVSGNTNAIFEIETSEDAEFEFDAVQLEAKPFATSFVDGTRATGRLVYPPNVFNPTEFTFAAWWKPVIDIPSRFSRIFQLDDGTASSTGRWLALRRSQGSKAIGLAGPNASGTSNVLYVEVTDNYDPNEWQFVACRRSGRDVYVRLNDTVAEDTLAFDPAPFNIVRFSIGSTGDVQTVLNGLINELLILPYAASDEEIQSWYEADSPLPPHPDATLQWDWREVRPAQMVTL